MEGAYDKLKSKYTITFNYFLVITLEGILSDATDGAVGIIGLRFQLREYAVVIDGHSRLLDLEMLCSKGAVTNARERNGDTPLHGDCHGQHSSSLIHELVEHGADIAARETLI